MMMMVISAQNLGLDPKKLKFLHEAQCIYSFFFENQSQHKRKKSSVENFSNEDDDDDENEDNDARQCRGAVTALVAVLALSFRFHCQNI